MGSAKDEEKEEVVSCNDISEEILPWTDAENSPEKPNIEDNITTSHNNNSFNNNSNNTSYNSNDLFNNNIKTSHNNTSHNNKPFNNSSDNSFINVCDKSNSNIDVINNDNDNFDNDFEAYHDNPDNGTSRRQSRCSKASASLTDVSKVTGLELILGTKQTNVEEAANNSVSLDFDANSLNVIIVFL